MWVHNNTCSRYPVVLSHQNPSTYLFRMINFSPDSDEMTFFSLKKAILWIEELYFSWKQWFEVKILMDLFITNMQLITLQDVKRWTAVVWIIVMFYWLFGLSFWRHPFTAEDPLISMWFNAIFLQICSDEETNSSTSCRWVVCHFWVNCSFRFLVHGVIMGKGVFTLAARKQLA